MKRNDIVNGLVERLEGATLSATLAMPNVEFAETKPRFEVSHPAAERTGGTLKGGEVKRELGRMMVVAVTELDIGEQPANLMGDEIDTLFPEGLIIAITGGNIVINAPVDIREGFRKGSDWRVPVIIRYLATST